MAKLFCLVLPNSVDYREKSEAKEGGYKTRLVWLSSTKGEISPKIMTYNLCNIHRILKRRRNRYLSNYHFDRAVVQGNNE